MATTTTVLARLSAAGSNPACAEPWLSCGAWFRPEVKMRQGGGCGGSRGQQIGPDAQEMNGTSPPNYLQRATSLLAVFMRARVLRTAPLGVWSA